MPPNVHSQRFQEESHVKRCAILAKRGGFSRNPRSSRASENSPSSIPSPTYQWTKARWEYMRSNLATSLWEKTRETGTLFPIVTTLRGESAMSSSAVSWGGSSLRPILKPVGHQSTKVTLLLAL